MIDLQSLIAQMQAKQTGRAPPPSMIPGGTPTMGNHMVPQPGQYGQQAQGLLGNPQPGPYGAQAQQLAGLLGFGGQQQFPVMGSPYQPAPFMPGFRPGVDTPIPSGGGRRPGRFQQV